MRDIYSRAKRAVVWLGPDEDGQASVAISIIRSTGLYLIKRQKEAPEQTIFGEEEEEFQLKIRGSLPSRGHADWQAVWWLFRREWFSRIWVIQEVAQDIDATIMIGDHSTTSFSMFSAALIFSGREYVKGVQDSQILWSLLSVHYHIVSSKALSHPPPHLLQLLSQFSMFKATNPRDKLYAIIGLSKKGQDFEKYPLIQPDYRKTTVETYTDLVRQLISAPRGQDYGESGLDVLGRIDITRYIEYEPSLDATDEERFPTWVPQFHRSIPYYSSLSTYNQALTSVTSYDSAVQFGPVLSPGGLALKGLRLSAVSKLYTNREYYRRAPGLAGLFAQVKNDLPNYRGPGSIAEAFAQTITTGDPNMVSEQDLDNYIKSRGADRSTYDPDRIKSIPDPISRYRMFLTDDGHMGFGAPPLIGSEIWLLFGGRTLYALHRSEHSFTFVGECFVHGYMNGEGMDPWKAGKLESEWVDLR